MTRGRCGSLLLHRDGLAPSTPCRSPGALRSCPKADKHGRGWIVRFVPIGDITRACSRTTDLARVHWRAHSHWHPALQGAEGRIGSRSTSISRSCRKWCDRRSRVWRTETRSPSEREPRDPNDLVWACLLYTS